MSILTVSSGNLNLIESGISFIIDMIHKYDEGK